MKNTPKKRCRDIKVREHTRSRPNSERKRKSVTVRNTHAPGQIGQNCEEDEMSDSVFFEYKGIRYEVTHNWPRPSETYASDRHGRRFQRSDESFVCLLTLNDGMEFRRTARLVISGRAAAMIPQLSNEVVLDFYIRELPTLMEIDSDCSWHGILETPEGEWFHHLFTSKSSAIEKLACR